MLTAKLLIIKRQAQPQAESVSDIYILNSTCVDIFLNTLNVPTDATFHKSHVQTHTRFIVSLSCDLEHDITMYTLHKFLISDDLAPYLSVILYTFQGIN